MGSSPPAREWRRPARGGCARRPPPRARAAGNLEIARSPSSLGLGTSSTTEITARLRARSLVTEHAPVQAGRRGRPSGLLLPHPADPSCSRSRSPIPAGVWRRSSSGGGSWSRLSDAARARRGDARRRPQRARRAAPCLRGPRRRGRRLGHGNRLGHEDRPGRDVPLGRGRPRRRSYREALRGLPFAAGNDATLAGLAEARRGAAAGRRRRALPRRRGRDRRGARRRRAAAHRSAGRER